MSAGHVSAQRCRSTRWSALAACLALAPLAAAAERPVARDVLLVTLDTTRADRLGAYGHAHAATPTIDRLAREGVLFEQAIAPTPITLPSHASLLTGVLPARHGVHDNGVFVLEPRARLLSEAFRDAGFRTGAFVGAVVLDRKHGLDQGFETYQGPTLDDPRPGVITERRADAVVEEAIAWLDGIGPDERFFAWVHFFDPHFPYDPPPPWRRPDPYDGEIAFADAQLARLLRHLAASGRDRGLLLAVTADHGESLGEHGEGSHGLFLYQATLRVPLVLRGPGIEPARAAAPVSIAALPATLAARAGLPADALPEAAPPLLGPDGRPAPVSASSPLFLESHYPYHTHRWRASRGLLRGDRKLIDGGRPELYDLAADPGETRDLAGERGEEVKALQRELLAWLDAHPPLDWAARRGAAFGEREALEALGYVLATTGEAPFDPSLPDGRDRLDDVERIRRAFDLSREASRLAGEPAAAAWKRQERDERVRALREEARALLRAVHAANPRDPTAARHLAQAEARLGNHAAAIALLEPLVRTDPLVGDVRFKLATSYERAGRPEDAEREMRIAADQRPDDPKPHRWLAARAEARGDLDAAIRRLSALQAALAPGPTADAVARDLQRLEASRVR